MSIEAEVFEQAKKRARRKGFLFALFLVFLILVALITFNSFFEFERKVLCSTKNVWLKQK